MLSYAGCNDSLFFHILGEIAESLDNALRFYKAVWSLLLISEG